MNLDWRRSPDPGIYRLIGDPEPVARKRGGGDTSQLA